MLFRSRSPGDTMVLEAAVTPSSATITWSSSNSAVADVSSGGLVTAKSVGSVVITAKAGNLSSSCTIEVTAANETGGNEELPNVDDDSIDAAP